MKPRIGIVVERRVQHQLRIAALQRDIVQRHAGAARVEVGGEIVRHRRVVSVLQLAVLVRQRAEISATTRCIVAGLKRQILQIGVEHGLLIVVVNRAAVEKNVANRQVEDVRVGIAAGLKCRQITLAVGIDDQLDDRMIDGDVLEIPLAVQNRNHAHAQADVVDLQQRLIRAGTDAVNRQPI